VKRQNLLSISLLLLTAGFIVGLGAPEASADYVVLKSGSRIEGQITEENAERVTIKVEGLGEIRFERQDIDHVEYRQIRRLPTDTPPPPPPTPIPTATRVRLLLEPTRAPLVAPTVTPRIQLDREPPRPTATPSPTARPAQPTAPRAERERVEAPPGWPFGPLEEEAPMEEGYEEGFSWDPREVDEEALQKQIETYIKGAQAFVYLMSFLFYLYLSLCRHVIATKTGTPNAWWAWIPVLRDLLLLRIGDNPAWYAALLYGGLGIQFAVSTLVDLPTYSAGPFAGFFYSIINLIGFLIWGFTSYVMWRDVCVARGKAKSVAYMMHLHVVGIAAFFCCCFWPFIIVGVVCYYIICPAFIAFYQ